MVSRTMSYSMPTPFSTSTCRREGRFCRLRPKSTPAVHSSTITTKEDTAVWVTGMPPNSGMVK